MNDNLFHYLYAAAFIALIVVRMLSWRSTPKEKGEVELKESTLSLIVRAFVGLGYILLMAVYAIIPRWFNWSMAPLPEPIRWLGAALTLASLALLIWVHWALGRNFNTTVHVREGHTLIDYGPYRRVRHPMYTALVMFGIGTFLLAANWLIGLPLALAVGLIMYLRTPHEEAVMIEQFGDAYRDYMRRTGRYLPRFFARG
ncbi:MAG: isoprenylcysteine carboxylmethyltransferase family protein [Anaerolineae bacterium]|nr:isoprenylcysteine carboxylmethyltransferase family protein [Anaerolineae bacterium]